MPSSEDTLHMQNLQEYESIQQHNYNQTYHGEKEPPPIENPLDEIIEDVEFNRLFDAYDDFDHASGDNEDVGGGYGDGVDEGPIDGVNNDSSDDKLDDGGFLSQLLRHTKAELLVARVGKLGDGEKNQHKKIYTSNLNDARNTGPFFVSYLTQLVNGSVTPGFGKESNASHMCARIKFHTYDR
jgi:hypothetical protein